VFTAFEVRFALFSDDALTNLYLPWDYRNLAAMADKRIAIGL
jgi:hypothetical protein